MALQGLAQLHARLQARRGRDERVRVSGQGGVLLLREYRSSAIWWVQGRKGANPPPPPGGGQTEKFDLFRGLTIQTLEIETMEC